MNLLWLFSDFLSILIKGLLRNWSGISLIFSEFSLKIGSGFHWFWLDFIMTFHWKLGFKTREIFHWIFGILIINFHWFDPVTAFLFLYHFCAILGFDYQVWFRKWGPNPNPLFQMWSTFHQFSSNFVRIWDLGWYWSGEGYRSWFQDLDMN